MERQSRDEKKYIVTKDMVGLLVGEVVSTKKTHHRKGCGWLAYRRGTVRLTSIHYRVSGNQNFCFAPTETVDGRVKEIRSPTCGMV